MLWVLSLAYQPTVREFRLTRGDFIDHPYFFDGKHVTEENILDFKNYSFLCLAWYHAPGFLNFYMSQKNHLVA